MKTIRRTLLGRILPGRELWDFVRTVIGLVLLAAAGLKGWQVLFQPASLALQSGVLSSKWAAIAIAEAEILLAVCLLMNVWRQVTWVATLLLFVLFAVYSANKGLSGEPCGCFGTAGENIPAAAMLVLDFIAIAALWFFRPDVFNRRALAEVGGRSFVADGGGELYGRRTLVATACLLGLVPLAGATIALHEPTATVIEPGLEVLDGGYTVVEPTDWIGKRLPLLEFIDIGERLAKGNWTVLVYHANCPKCSSALDRLATAPPSKQIALIEVPPVTDGARDRRAPVARSRARSSINESTRFQYGQLSSERTWFVKTPLELRLDEGRVVAVSS